MRLVRSKGSLLLAVTLVTATVAETSYAAIVTGNGSAPGTNVMISQLTSDGVEDIRWRSAALTSTGTRDLRQTFTTPANTAGNSGWSVTAISFLVYQDVVTDSALTTQGLNMLVDLFSTTGVNDGAGTGSLIGGSPTGDSGLTASANFPADTLTWLTFTLATPEALNANTVYGMKIHFGSISNLAPRHELSNVYYFGGEAASGGPYAGGRMFRFRPGNDGAWSEDTDLAFVIQGTEIPEGVPEPSTFALAGIGLVGAIAARRRRRA